ncbi:MAG TPA: DUF4397 domain-containing protein [Actinomycetota bacterium]|nr:DUF4397 domain-containing protein [Actinomycetota bacterium]
MTLRKLLAQAMMLAVAAGSVFVAGAVPASAGAGTATIFIVHGLPGAGKVDICIGGSGEVASRVPYATRVKERVAAGKVNIKVRKASKGQCKGKLLAAGGATLAANANRTFVASVVAGKGKVTHFKNEMAPTAPGENRLTAAHKMAAKALDVLNVGDRRIQGLAPGASATASIQSGGVYSLWAAKAGSLNAVAGPRLVTKTDEGQAFTVVLVGNTKAPTRQIVLFKQNVGVA